MTRRILLQSLADSALAALVPWRRKPSVDELNRRELDRLRNKFICQDGTATLAYTVNDSCAQISGIWICDQRVPLKEPIHMRHGETLCIPVRFPLPNRESQRICERGQS